MILAIDIGNTNIVIGCVDEKKTYFIERLATVKTKTELEYAIDIKVVLELYGISREDIKGGIICSVVPQITSIVRLAAEKVLRRQILVVGPGIKTGLNILMDNPAQLGSDLVAGAVAGINEYPLYGHGHHHLRDRREEKLYRRQDSSRGDGFFKFTDGPCCAAAGDQSGTAQADDREEYH